LFAQASGEGKRIHLISLNNTKGWEYARDKLTDIRNISSTCQLMTFMVKIYIFLHEEARNNDLFAQASGEGKRNKSMLAKLLTLGGAPLGGAPTSMTGCKKCGGDDH
jgi:hypothetical protein